METAETILLLLLPLPSLSLSHGMWMPGTTDCLNLAMGPNELKN